MKPLLAAVQFLTRLPCPTGEPTERQIGRSALFFPVVGLLIGALLVGTAEVAALTFPPMVTRAIVLVMLIVVSGAFHLDGLADMVDGLYAGRDREDALRIMRDPHVGAMGVTAIGAVLLLKTAAAFSLDDDRFLAASLATPVVGRGFMVVALALPYARPDGLGAVFARHRSVLDPIVAVATMAAVCAAVLGIPGLRALAGAALGAAGTLFVAWRRLRGVTGDVCGAVNEISETSFLVALSSFDGALR